MRVLIVEDETPTTEILTRFLRRILGSDPEIRTTPAEEPAMTEIVDWDPDLIITDYELKPGNGLAVIREARARNPSTAIIFMSGRLDAKLAMEALDAGANQVLAKPFRFDEFATKVAIALAGG